MAGRIYALVAFGARVLFDGTPPHGRASVVVKHFRGHRMQGTTFRMFNILASGWLSLRGSRGPGPNDEHGDPLQKWW